jgi:hypothetical protein
MINLTEAQEYLSDIPEARIKSECPDLPEAIWLLREAEYIITELRELAPYSNGKPVVFDLADLWLSEVQL